MDDAGYADRVIERFHESSYLIEKDYWLMHGLWALQKEGWQFQLTGGTSLSKGFGIIQRFSEHIDRLRAMHKANLFECIDDDTELLLPDNLLRTDSVTAKLVAVVLKDACAQVEINEPQRRPDKSSL